MSAVSPAIAIHVPATAADDVLDLLPALLDDFGPLAIHEGIDAGEPGAGPATIWEVHFGSNRARTAAGAAVAARFGRFGVACTAFDVADEGWAERSQASLRAVRVGGVVVAPPWNVPETAPPALVIIRPSTGFGTGHHATTRLCLKALQRLDLTARTVVDAGTGSAVLAMAAVRLGARVVHGIDCDPEALASARDNLTLNGLSSQVVLAESDLSALPGLGIPPADVVVANLTAAVLERHAEVLCRQLTEGGILIVSGVTTDQAAAVKARFEVDGHLRLATCDDEDDWVALIFSLTAPPR